MNKASAKLISSLSAYSTLSETSRMAHGVIVAQRQAGEIGEAAA